ncbi:hypothetical protein ACFOW6_15715 [Fodinicurvata halophila]|uniref:Uncharacterized protein n=1 Tax=Fodinicurvata halophila TaxID=1419723 RepID=A0ABV8UQC5_9PROT
MTEIQQKSPSNGNDSKIKEKHSDELKNGLENVASTLKSRHPELRGSFKVKLNDKKYY